jgi:thiol-disulfide isomerase/thioredoxin
MISLQTAFPQPIDSIDVVLKGKIEQRPDQKLYLIRGHEDVRNQQQTFDVTNGEFQYTIKSYPGEAFKLIFGEEFEKGAFRPILFFIDTNHIEFVLKGENEAHLHEVKGGSINKTHHQYLLRLQEWRERLLNPLMAQSQDLFKKEKYHSPAYKALVQSLENKTQDEKLLIYTEMDALQKDGKHLTEEASQISKAYEEKNLEILKWKYEEFVKHDFSAISLYFMLEDIRFQKDNPVFLNYIALNYPEYAARLEDHPYVDIVGRELKGALGLSVGNLIMNFEAPDLKGQAWKLYPLLSANKVTLLNLWGSWCGPCIAKSRTMVPILNTYGDKGFGIVGVAREYKNTKNLQERLKLETFDWLNLVDLDDQHQIWSQFGISNAAGMMILLNQEGKILAIDPSASEVKEVLEALL